MSSTTVKKNALTSVERLLDLALLTYGALILLGYGFYATILNQNLQNAILLVMIGILAVLTWSVRSRITKLVTYSEIRTLLIQWGVISILIIIFSIVLVIIYPIG